MKVQTAHFLLLFLMLCSCSTKNEHPKTETAFYELSKRYDTLIMPSKSHYSNYYDHLISIENHRVKMKFGIFQKIGNKESYVLTIQFKNKMCAIPIFPYSNKCFWNFENEKHTCDSPNLNFQNEYNRMLVELSLDDSSKLVMYPYFIIRNNVLLLESMRLQDSTEILNEGQLCIDEKEESFARKRNRKNLNELIKLIHPTEYTYRNRGSIDQLFQYVFWAEHEKNKHQKSKFVLKAFNFNCNKPQAIYL